MITNQNLKVEMLTEKNEFVNVNECIHSQKYYDSIAGDMICKTCGLIISEKNQITDFEMNKNRLSFSSTQPNLKSFLTVNKNNNVQITNVITKYNNTSNNNYIKYIYHSNQNQTLEHALVKIKILKKTVHITDRDLENLMWYYRKIPKKYIVEKLLVKQNKDRKNEQFRCFEYLYTLFYYTHINTFMSIEEYLLHIKNEGFMFRQYRFDNIVILLKTCGIIEIEKLIKDNQFNRSKQLNVRINSMLQKIINKIPIENVKLKGFDKIIQSNKHYLIGNKSEFENFKIHLLHSCQKMIHQINFSNIHMKTESVVASIIYINVKGQIDQKTIGSLCGISSLSIINHVKQFKILLDKKINIFQIIFNATLSKK